jgi:hypothetical protein
MKALDSRYEATSRRRGSGARFVRDRGPATVDAKTAVLKGRRRLLRDYSIGRWPRRCRELRAAEPQSRYGSTSSDRPWTTAEDDFLRNEWHLLPVEEIARRLGRDTAAVNARRRRLGIRRYDDDELTLRALQRLTGLEKRQWRELIDRGWLPARVRVRRAGAQPVVCVTVDDVRSLLKRHPEVLDYRQANRVARFRLELDSLPVPPRYKRLRCTSAISIALGPPAPKAVVAATEGQALQTPDRDWMPSCAEIGGTAFWAPVYASPTCPRCGAAMTAFSPDGVHSDVEPETLTQGPKRRKRIEGFGRCVAGSGHTKLRRHVPSPHSHARTATHPDEEERASASRQTP